MVSHLPGQAHALSCADPYPEIPASYEGDIDALVRDFWVRRLTSMYEDTNSIWVGVLTEGAKGSLEERAEVRWSQAALGDLVEKQVFGRTEVRVSEAFSFSGTVFDAEGAHDVDGQAVTLISSCQVDGGPVCSAPYPMKQLVVVSGYWFASGNARLEPWACPNAIPLQVLGEVLSIEDLEDLIQGLSR